jgi:gamma-glutamyltranspeptidase / glutathione hydrolase
MTIVRAPGSRAATDYARTAIDRIQGRSMVISTRGVVASEHPAASLAGATILARGGHAVDAAIAANAMMGVVSPNANGLGGDLFAIVYDAGARRLSGINASGWAPAGLSIDFLHARGIATMPQSGIHAVTVPGVVAGWTLLQEDFGRQSLADVLEPAAKAAEDGMPVAEFIAAEWASSTTILQSYDATAPTYLPGGVAPRVGEVFRNPALARTLRQVGQHGRDAFYAGDIARTILACSSRLGGTMAASDLAEFTGERISPLSTTYRGWTVSELPPNGQGISALMMLNMMEQFPLGDYGHNSAASLHVMIEAKKLAYADMARHLADPRFSSVPVSSLLSKEYARERAGLIDAWRAQPDVPAGALPAHAGDTTYLCAVDAAGNVVSLIQSNFANFGSGLVPDGLGFALQNRGGLFNLQPGHPNALEGRKRPLHTIIPGFMSDGSRHIAFGIMGGWNQSQAHAQFVSNVVDHGLNIQAALEAPRFTKLTFEGCDVTMEDRIPEPVRAALGVKGHDIEVQGGYSSMVGGGQSVMRDANGVNYGASDPRKDGAAIPEPLI